RLAALADRLRAGRKRAVHGGAHGRLHQRAGRISDRGEWRGNWRGVGRRRQDRGGRRSGESGAGGAAIVGWIARSVTHRSESTPREQPSVGYAASRLTHPTFAHLIARRLHRLDDV